MSFRVFQVGKVHLGQRVGLDHRGDSQDFVGLDGSHEGGDGLPNDNEHTLDGVGMFRSEGGCNAGVSELDFIITDHHPAKASTVPCILFVCLFEKVNLLLEGNGGIISNIENLLIELLLLLLLLLFLLHHFADIGSAHHRYSYVGCPQTSHVICAVACVKDAAIGDLFKVLDDHFLIVWAGAREDRNELEVVVGEILGGRSGNECFLIVRDLLF